MLFNRKRLERKYREIVDQVLKKAQEQARSRRIDLRYEPSRVLQSIPFPGNTDGEDYWFVADYILAEYEVELGLEVLAWFNELLTGQLGFGPYGKVLVEPQPRTAARCVQNANFMIKFIYDAHKNNLSRCLPPRDESWLCW